MNYISNLPAICAGGGLATNGSDQKGDLAWKVNETTFWILIHEKYD